MSSIQFIDPPKIEENFLTDNHKQILYYNEKDLGQEGLIEKVENAYYDINQKKLLKYAQNNEQLFKKYIIKKIYNTDEDIQIEDNLINSLKNVFYIREFIEENGLIDDYHKFILKNRHLFVNVQDKNKIRKDILSSLFNQILQISSYKYIYVYRDTDHKSILITKL